MSENENGFLLKRISELERALVEANADAKKRRLQAKASNKELADLKAEREQLAKERELLKASPGEWQAKYESLQGELRARDHRDAWMKVVGAELNDKVELADVFAKIQYRPGDEIPSEAEIRNQVKAAREVAPYLFRNGQPSEAGTPAPAGAQKPPKEPAKVSFEASRGDRDTGTSRFKVLRSDMRDAQFMMTHSKQIAEASKKGILDIVPD